MCVCAGALMSSEASLLSFRFDRRQHAIAFLRKLICFRVCARARVCVCILYVRVCSVRICIAVLLAQRTHTHTHTSAPQLMSLVGKLVRARKYTRLHRQQLARFRRCARAKANGRCVCVCRIRHATLDNCMVSYRIGANVRARVLRTDTIFCP